MDFLFAFCLLLQQDEVEKLKERVKQLETEIEKLRQGKQDEEIEKLKKKLKSLETDLEKMQEEQLKQKDKGSDQVRPNLLNPGITVFLNGAARIDDDTVTTSSGSEVDDHIFLRGAELDFRASVDPYVDAVLIVAIEQAGDGFEAEVEEGYGIIKRLPILESAPLGMRIKAGRYRPPLGTVNTLHLHDLPWTTRPLPISDYLGSEGGSFFEGGYAMEGAGVMVRLPSFESTSLDLEVHVADAGDIAFTEDNDGQNPAGLFHLGFFWKPGETHEISLGLSGYAEGGSLRGDLAIVDVLYRWRPIGEFRSLVVGGEFFYVGREFKDDMDVERRNSPVGFYLFAQYQIDWHWYAGVRYDSAEDLDDDDATTQVLAAYVSYYTSEYFRIRLGHEHRVSDFAEEDGLDSVFIEFNFVFGSHPPEPWWVNR